jgi:DNA-binding MarR family transcriptional regulator/GNAT superfamily N-acetyltransferase
MADARIAAVRRFNRFYTRQIGILHQGVLRSPFSLAEVRVLYEIVHRREVTATLLAQDLGLDPGYLSRMLRRFQKLGLLRRQPAAHDGRRQLLTLTEKGRRTFATLDARQDEDVAGLLAPLPANGQRRLVESMQAIEQLLGAPTESKAPYLIRQHQPGDMGWVTHRHGVLYWQEYGYDERFEALVAKVVAVFIRTLEPARERCWIAEKDGEIVGSVFLMKKSATVSQLRLLYVEPSTRGLGIGSRLVDECIRFARGARYRKMTLWTQSELLAARHIYQKAGFTLTSEQQHDSWGRRGLVAQVWDLAL